LCGYKISITFAIYIEKNQGGVGCFIALLGQDETRISLFDWQRQESGKISNCWEASAGQEVELL
jgi:hypothetical protein